MDYNWMHEDHGPNNINPDDNIESDSIRRDFPVTHRKVYMNNGAIAPTPLSTIKGVTDFLVKSSKEGPGSTIISEYITSLMKELRMRITHLINCEPEEVVFTQSTTEGLNYVSSGINWNRKNNDSIIVRGGSEEQYANYLYWLRVSK